MQIEIETRMGNSKEANRPKTVQFGQPETVEQMRAAIAASTEWNRRQRRNALARQRRRTRRRLSS